MSTREQTRQENGIRAAPVAARRDRGFALLLTLTLLAFAVLLLVGLATYTRVETAIAGNTQGQAQARENALLALNVALDQLQKHAGPDMRVTATAEAFNEVNAQKRYYTGVWSTEQGAADAPAKPVAWLVSGAENLEAFDLTAPLSGATATLVGARTDGSSSAQSTAAALVDIRAPGVPGVSGNAVIGRYAWWVGDQGVKAPVAVTETPDVIDYAPFVEGAATDLRARIRQQIGLGAGAADATTGEPAFEVRDANNASLVAGGKLVAANQLALLRNGDNDALGLATLRTNYHAWSPSNFAVLANTKLGGLREDLSLNPRLLGDGFAKWVSYNDYMEPLTAVVPNESDKRPAISPAYGTDPIRRRYYMQPPANEGGVNHSIGPVLTYFLLSFSFGTEGDSAAAAASLELRARWMFSLWNPYTAALVPENLRMEIEGLPTVRVFNETKNETEASVSLNSVYATSSTTTGNPALLVQLPWDATSDAERHQSWLPGRVHTWVGLPNTDVSVPADGYGSRFDTRELDRYATKTAAQRRLGVPVSGADNYRIVVAGPTNLTIRLVRISDNAVLKTFRAPAFEAFATDAAPLSKDTYQFSYLFRLAESFDTADAPETWLLGPGRDPRRGVLGPSAFVPGENGARPELYPNWNKIDDPNRLLSRSRDGFEEDVPVFELPRSPILSLGALQHLPRSNRRAFGIGNSWGRFGQLNGVPVSELFDRYFFSGLASGVTPAASGDLFLPNRLLKPIRKRDSAKVTFDDIRALVSPPATTDSDGNAVESGEPSFRSSKFFLQGGAFNINSTNVAAWIAVLRSVRFVDEPFRYLDLSTETATSSDESTMPVMSGNGHFFRFSQSAQETYKSGDEESSLSNPAYFRKGMIALPAGQVAALAKRIVELIQARHVALGPFRSLEEFLQPLPESIADDDEGESPAPDTTIIASFGQSLLERAIADVGINASLPGFSSQWLTQADIMTALAPFLFARSDTFVVRAYGEAVNPAKVGTDGTVPANAVEGRAWCEATVQRLPEYFDPADDPTVLPGDLQRELNRRYGRRFRVVSFRWLTLSDI